jgi:putative membrane protein
MILSKIKVLLRQNNMKVFILYLVMLSGGMIQFLELYQKEMGLLATFVIAAISGLIYVEYFWHVREAVLKKSDKINQLQRFTLWLGLVFVLSMVVENIGVWTGMVFGRYSYGPVLNPFIGDVPLAIGFAWINTLVPAMMISKLFVKHRGEIYDWLSSVLVGILMVIFDIILEKAAIELNYWSWQNGDVPYQNYAAWFLLGAFFARIGLYLKINRYNFPKIYLHVYLAQLGYFLLVIIR